MKVVVDGAGARRADLAAIHIGKKALNWSDDEYRDILWTVCNVRSSGDLDIAGRKRFLAHMRQCGFEGSATTKPRRPPLTPQQAKAWSLWQQLADAAKVADRRMSGLDAFARRQTQVDKLVWCNDRQMDLVVESLKRWLKRGTSDAA